MINEELDNCPYCGGDRSDDCGASSHYAIAELRAELAELREANRWIPVEERLPEAGVKAIATDGDHVDMALYDYNNEWDWWVPIGNADEEITHWRPLPTPPEVE